MNLSVFSLKAVFNDFDILLRDLFAVLQNFCLIGLRFTSSLPGEPVSD
jgi:hypothetical protein